MHTHNITPDPIVDPYSIKTLAGNFYPSIYILLLHWFTLKSIRENEGGRGVMRSHLLPYVLNQGGVRVG